VAVTEVVLEVVALVLEGIEGLVLDFPACAGTSHQRHEVVRLDRDIRDPGEVGHGAVGGVLPVLEGVHLQVEVGLVEGRAVEVTETVAEPLPVVKVASAVCAVAATQSNRNVWSRGLAPRIKRRSSACR
jgi:hypothetical protein